MDADTLEWILRERPMFAENRRLLPASAAWQEVSKLALRPEYFLDLRMMAGIHGELHAYRVALYANILSRESGLDDDTRHALTVAGLLHDVRRKDDKQDLEHGERCAIWLWKMEHSIELLERFSLSDIGLICAAIRMHDAPDALYERASEYASFQKNIDIIKAADALDRYRLPKKKWWIDDAFLRIKPSPAMRLFAFDLIMGSESLALAGKNTKKAISTALLPGMP